MSRSRPRLARLVAPVTVAVVALAAVPAHGAAAAAEASSTPTATPTAVVAPPVEINRVATMPVEDVAGPVQDSAGQVQDPIFPVSSADGAIRDEGDRDFILSADVLFAFNKATLTSRARTEIARIAGVLKSGQSTGSAKITAVRVSGYTDDVGSDGYNQGLSRRRAAVVRDELIKVLGSTLAVTAVGRGEQDPVASNDTKRGRQANRRVEIRGR